MLLFNGCGPSWMEADLTPHDLELYLQNYTGLDTFQCDPCNLQNERLPAVADAYVLKYDVYHPQGLKQVKEEHAKRMVSQLKSLEEEEIDKLIEWTQNYKAGSWKEPKLFYFTATVERYESIPAAMLTTYLLNNVSNLYDVRGSLFERVRDNSGYSHATPSDRAHGRGLYLDSCSDLRRLHNSFAEPQRRDSRKHVHYVLYQVMNGKLYEFDSLKPMPVKHGFVRGGGLGTTLAELMAARTRGQHHEVLRLSRYDGIGFPSSPPETSPQQLPLMQRWLYADTPSSAVSCHSMGFEENPSPPSGGVSEDRYQLSTENPASPRGGVAEHRYPGFDGRLMPPRPPGSYPVDGAQVIAALNNLEAALDINGQAA